MFYRERERKRGLSSVLQGSQSLFTPASLPLESPETSPRNTTSHVLAWDSCPMTHLNFLGYALELNVLVPKYYRESSKQPEGLA